MHVTIGLGLALRTCHALRATLCGRLKVSPSTRSVHTLHSPSADLPRVYARAKQMGQAG